MSCHYGKLHYPFGFVLLKCGSEHNNGQSDKKFMVLYLPRIQGKYHITDSDIQAFILTLMTKTDCVAGKLTLKDVAPDPGNDKIISCAVEAQADFIVTGDKSLQQLGEYQGIKIINAETFIKVLEDRLKI